MSFPGTLTLEAETYMEALTEVCECIAEHGFTKIAMINGHGGNRLPTQTVIMNIVEELGFPVYFLEYHLGSEQVIRDTLETQNQIVHACEAETSMMLAYYPELVDPIYKETKGGNITKDTKLGAGAYTFSRFETKTECGALGNSYAATPEKGKIILEAMGKNLAKAVSDLWD
jgi:creatinine amidohydrolase